MKTLRLIFLIVCLGVFLPAGVKAELPPGMVRVTAPVLNVRGGPGPDFPVINRVQEGLLLRVIDVRPGWLQVRRPGGVLGWISANGAIRVN